MTPAEINTAARQRYNAVGDSFWSDDEIYNLIYQACQELAAEAFVIERIFTTTSVASQQEYEFPSYALGIKRVTYDGKKLAPMSFREDDVLTVLDQDTSATGVPTGYVVFNNVMYLRPIPSSSSVTIKVFAHVEPQPVTSSSTLEVPSEFHMGIVDYVISEMAAKNKNYQGAQYYRARWEQTLQRAKRLTAKKKRTDGFALVKNVDITPHTELGTM